LIDWYELNLRKETQDAVLKAADAAEYLLVYSRVVLATV